MANTTIRLKKSGTSGNTPSTLEFGELSLNYSDGKLFYKNDVGTIVSISNQDTFSTINANSSLILASSPTDTLSIAAGNNITITACTVSKIITIGAPGGTSVDSIARDLAQSAYDTANGANGLAAGAYNQANVTIGVDVTQNTRLDSIETINTNQNTSISIIQGVDLEQNTTITAVNNFAQSAFNTANGANGLAAGAFNQANTTAGGLLTANAAITIIQGVDLGQNTSISIIQGVDATQNTRLNSLETINTDQNTAISIIQGVDLGQNATITAVNQYAAAAYAQANTNAGNITVIQGVDNTQNTRLNAIETINTNQNNAITIIQGVDLTQNTQIAGLQGVDLAQNASITIIQGVDLGQNTTITAVNNFAQSAFNKANTGVTSSSFLANTILVANSTGFVSNSSMSFSASNNTVYLPSNVGIGTNNPGSKLTVSGGNYRLTTAGTDGTSGYELFDSVSGGNHIGSITRRANGIGIASYDFLAFYTNATASISGGSEKMRVFASGGVSIGNTTDPGASNLSVTGSFEIPATTTITTYTNDPTDSTNKVFAYKVYPKISVNPASLTNGDSVTVGQVSGTYVPTSVSGNSIFGYGLFGIISSDAATPTGYATTDMRGIYGNVYHNSASNLLKMVGAAGRTYNRSTGTVGNAYSLWARNSTNTGGGTITASYGVYIDSISSGATNYALYSAGGQSYFTGNVGIGSGKTTPATALDVNGTVTATTISLAQVDATSNTFTTASTAQVSIDAWPTATYRAAKYFVQITSESAYHIIELNLVHNGTTVFLAQYGEVLTGSSLGTFDADISGATVRLLFTGVNAVSTIKVLRTVIDV